MMDGWIKLHRRLINKPIWKNSTPEQKAILITVLAMANHEQKEWEWLGAKYKVTPGQFVTSLDSIRKAAGKGISIQNVRSSLARFKKLEFLTYHSTKTGRIITICNWDTYQQIRSSTQHRSQQKCNKEATTNKEGKETKKDMYRSFAHLKITVAKFHELVELGYTKCQIDDILDSIENYKDNKKYLNLYLTAKKWLSKSIPEATQNKTQVRQPDVFDSLNEQRIAAIQKN